MPTYGIARISDKHSQGDGPSIDVQISVIQRVAAKHGLKLGGTDIRMRETEGYPPGMFVDLGRSAYKTRCWERPETGRCLRHLQPGDTVIVSRIDRLFRRMSDFCQTMAVLRERGVTLLVAEPELDFSSACGKLLVHVLMAFAEFESSINSERVRNANMAKAARKRGEKPKELTVDGDSYSKTNALSRDIRDKLPGGRIWIYRRVSSKDQVDSGRGLEWQRKVGMAEADEIINRRPEMALGGEFVDAGVSASRFNLRDRPEGRKLCEIVRPGDTVIFPRLDRGFRSTRDMLNTLPDWIKAGIEVRIVDQRIDFTKWTGMLVLESLSLAASIESRIRSASKLEVNAWLRAHGRQIVGDHLRMMKKVQVRTKDGIIKKLVWDRDALAHGRLLSIYRRQGMTYRQILYRFMEFAQRRNPRKKIKLMQFRWGEQDLRNMARVVDEQWAMFEAHRQRNWRRKPTLALATPNSAGGTASAGASGRPPLPVPVAATPQ